MQEEKDDKKKQSLFNKDEKKWLVLGGLYVVFWVISRIDLIGTALVILCTLIGLGIKEHGIYTREIHVIDRETKLK